MKRFSKKLAALLLVAVMAVSLFPSSVFAADEAGNNDPAVVEQTGGLVEDETDAAETTAAEETTAEEKTSDETTAEETATPETTAEETSPAEEATAPEEATAAPTETSAAEPTVPETPVAPAENSITAQPQDAIVAPYGKAVFEVQTIGKVSSYKWQYSTDGWSWWNYGSKKSSITVTGWNYNNGNMYRCIVTFKDGTKVTSDAAVLHVASSQSFRKSAKKADNADVSVKAPAGTFPDGTSMEVTDVAAEKYVDAISQELGDVAVADITAVDISFKFKKEEIEPANDNKVTVTITSDAIKADSKIVHIDDSGIAKEVPASDIVSITDGEVVFMSDAFSVYAVVGEGSTDDNARMTVEFYDYNGTTPLETSYVKNSDTLAELVDIIFDPNPNIPSGKLFKGWVMNKQDYTVDDAENAMTLGDIRKWAEEKSITENETVKFYALVYTSFRVTYKDGDQIIVGTENKLYPYNTESIPYTVNMAYTSADDEHNFEGWIAVDGRSNITSASYVNEDGQTVTIDTNDPNAIYPNTASLTITGNVTFGVSAPEGHWLIFHENGKNATYNAPDFIKANEVTSEPAEPERYGYTFGGWYTDADCTSGNEFTFGSAITETTHIYAKWTARATAPYTIIIWKQNVDGENYDFEETVTGTGNVGSNIPLGNTTSRSYTGFHLKETPTAVSIVAEGTSVVHVYYDRNQYTLTFQDYTWTVSTNDNDNNPAKYGVVNNQRVRVYWRNNAWRLTNTNNGQVYTGTRYTHGTNWQTVKTITALYEQDIRDEFPIVGSNGFTYATGTRWMPQSNLNVDGQQYFTTDVVVAYIDLMTPGNMTLRWNDPEERTDKTMVYWIETINNTPSSADVETITYNGTLYEEYKTVVAKYNGVTVEDYINLEGFSHVGATNTNLQTVTPQTGGNHYYQRNNVVVNEVYFFYSRNSYVINFMDGVYVNGDGNPMEEENRNQLGTSESIYYQTDISSYNKGGSDYFEPTYTGYVLDGWYIDSACTTPYTFNKMPKDGVTVYAKWVQVQYRVFLHPNVPESDTTLSWGDEELDDAHKQQMNFRVSLGDTVSAPDGTRQDYEMVGWYLDPECTQLFNDENYILNESTVTESYDKTTHMTDPMNKYGNIEDESSAYNSDVNRNWISKEFNIYAKWRKVIDGAEGIGVVYNAGDGSGTAPEDSSLYLDTASATALTGGQLVPPTPAEGSEISEYVFDYWVIQTWDEQNKKYVDTSSYVYPGDTFMVLLDNAKKEPKLDDSGNQIIKDGVAQYIYTVQLRAEYVPKEVETNTHIDWFANNGTGDSISDSKDGKLKINEPVNIRPATTFSRPGYKFIGWARVEDEEGGTHPDKPLDEDDLWLIYDEASSTFKVKEEDGSLRTVTQIAADERQPYHDLYAVWTMEFYVFHSSDGTVDTYTADDLDKYGKFDITACVKDGYMYGGYYKDYAKKGSYAGDGKAVGDSVPYAGGLGPWRAANAYGSAPTSEGDGGTGTAMVPFDGHTYFLKEVPNGFLQAIVYVIYDTIDNNRVKHNYLIADVDDNNYSDIGLIAENITTGDRIKLSTAYTINDTFNNKTDKITAKTTFGMQAGYVAVWKPALATKDFTFVPYYVTPDGVKVEGGYVREVTIGDGTYKGNFNPGNGGFAIEKVTNTYIKNPGQLSNR